jgi:hypothetical protein
MSKYVNMHTMGNSNGTEQLEEQQELPLNYIFGRLVNKFLSYNALYDMSLRVT